MNAAAKHLAQPTEADPVLDDLLAEFGAHLHHTNIVPVYAVGTERGVHYYAMQFIEGHTLAALIGELRQLSALDARKAPSPPHAVSERAKELVSGALDKRPSGESPSSC